MEAVHVLAGSQGMVDGSFKPHSVSEMFRRVRRHELQSITEVKILTAAKYLCRSHSDGFARGRWLKPTMLCTGIIPPQLQVVVLLSAGWQASCAGLVV